MKSIVEIVEKYTEKCSISTIRVDESSKKLIIEPQNDESSLPKVPVPQKLEELPFEAEYVEGGLLNTVIIKQEPGLMIEENSFIEDDSMTFNEGNDDEDDKDYSEGESFQHYFGGGDSSEPGTSTSARRQSSQQRSRSRTEPNEGERQLFFTLFMIFVSIDGEFFIETIVFKKYSTSM